MILSVVPALAARLSAVTGGHNELFQELESSSPTTLGVTLTAPARVARGSEWDVSCVITNQGPDALLDVGLQLRRVPGLEILSAQPGTLDVNCCSNWVIAGVTTNLPAGTNVTVTVRLRAARAGVWPVGVLAFTGTNDPSAADDEKFVYAEPDTGIALAPDFSLPFASATWSAAAFRWVAWTGRTVVFLAPNTLEPVKSLRFPGVVSAFHVNENGRQAWGILENGEAARLNLDTGAVDLQFPVALSISPEQGTIASSPLDPRVLVAFGPDGEGQPRAIGYTNGVPGGSGYTNGLSAEAGPYRLVISSDQKVFVALGTQLRQLALEGAGLTLTTNLDTLGRAGGRMSTAFGWLYNGAGEVINLNTLQVLPVGTLSEGLPDGFGFGFELAGAGQLKVRAYNALIPGFVWSQSIAATQLPNAVSGGLFGVMFLGAEGGLVTVPPNFGVDVSLSANLTNTVAALDEIVTIPVTVAKTGIWNAVNTRLIAEFSPGLAALSPASTSNRWVYHLGVIEQSTLLEVSFRVKQVGASSLTLHVESDYSDPDTANNDAFLVLNASSNKLMLEDVSLADDGQPLTLRLASPAEEDIEVQFRLELLSASLDDVTSNRLTARFAKGESTTTLALVSADENLENDETLRLIIDTALVAATHPSALITITNDDRITIRTGTNSVLEGHTGATVLPVMLILSEAWEFPITLDYILVSGTATAGTDFEAASGTVTFAPGQQTNVIDVRIIGDRVLEAAESFTLALSGAPGVVASGITFPITLQNDDQVRVLLADAKALEGNSGTNVFPVPVVLETAAEVPVEVAYSLRAGTAIAGADFVATTGLVVFAPGQQTNVISVEIIGDQVEEADETLLIELTARGNVELPAAPAVLTLGNDDEEMSKVTVLRVRTGEGGTLLVSLDTVGGKKYQVESRPSLAEGDWVDNGAPWTGNGEVLEVEVSSRGREGYFRVRSF